MPAALAQPVLVVPSLLKNFTDARLVKWFSSLRTMACRIFCTPAFSPGGVVGESKRTKASETAVYAFAPAEIQTPCPGVRCAGRNPGLVVVSVKTPPRAKDKSDQNGGTVAPVAQLY